MDYEKIFWNIYIVFTIITIIYCILLFAIGAYSLKNDVKSPIFKTSFFLEGIIIAMIPQLLLSCVKLFDYARHVV
jgi:hypothetical protein